MKIFRGFPSWYWTIVRVWVIFGIPTLIGSAVFFYLLISGPATVPQDVPGEEVGTIWPSNPVDMIGPALVLTIYLGVMFGPLLLWPVAYWQVRRSKKTQD